MDLIPHPAKDRKLLGIGPDGVGRVIKAPVMTVHLTWKGRARLIGVAADSDDGFNILMEEIVHVLRVMGGDVDADLLHHLDSEGMHIPRGIRTGALYVEEVTGDHAKDAFGEVAATGIAGTQDQDGGQAHGFGHGVLEVRMADTDMVPITWAAQQQSDCRAFHLSRSLRKTGCVVRQS